VTVEDAVELDVAEAVELEAVEAVELEVAAAVELEVVATAVAALPFLALVVISPRRPKGVASTATTRTKNTAAKKMFRLKRMMNT